MEDRTMPNKPSRAATNEHLLTDSYVKGLPAQAQPYLDWDAKQDKLAVRVQPSGHKSFKFIYSRHGRPRWFSIGDSNIGIAKARKEAVKLLALVNDGGDPAADKKARRSAGTFEELSLAYVERYASTPQGNKSWEQADALVKKHLIPKWGKLKAADITRSDVNAMMTRIKAPIVANQTLAAASAIFSWAIKKEEAGIKINPCTGVDRNNTTDRERVLSDSEIPKFWNAFENDIDPLEGLALKTILLTGQRPGEVSHMRTEHIKDGWWEMPGAPVPALDWPGTKNGLSHRVWLPQAVQHIITELQPTGFVFAAPRAGAIQGLAAAMRGICKQLKIDEDDRATPHDLRRTFGTKVTGLGFGRDAMDRILNHKKSKKGKKKTTDVYDRFEYAPKDKIIVEAVGVNIVTLIGAGADNVLHPSFGKAV
jgi:integrase